MGTKLNTRGELTNTPVVNVRDKVGQTFTGLLLGHRSVALGYGDKNVYEFEIHDTDMPLQVKRGDEYVEATVKQNEKVAIFASTRLDFALHQAQPGQTIKITYLGLGKKPKRGGNRPHEYDVEVL